MLNRRVCLAVLSLMLVGLFGVSHATAAEVEKININTATVEELVQLNGVGPKYAERIIAYREKYGPFKTPEELMQVKGIGQKTFEKNREVIIVAEPIITVEEPEDD